MRIFCGLARPTEKFGNTLMVIEHSLDMIKTADWLINMGPRGRGRPHGNKFA